jgi:cobalt/nickel transport system permease protein
VFADGGLLALGANVVNMALVGCAVGHCVYRLVCASAPSHTRRVAAAAFAGFCAVVSSAAACAEELALSGTARLSVVLPAMVGVHAIIGLGEAVITGLVVASVLRARPELAERSDRARQSGLGRATLGYGLFLALVAAILLAPVASTAPDGLMRVAGRLGLHHQRSGALSPPLTDYHVPGLGVGVVATIAAGALGTLVMFGLCWGLAFMLVPRRRASEGARAVESSG